MLGGSKRAPVWVGGSSEKVSLEIILKVWRMRESWHVVWGLGKGDSVLARVIWWCDGSQVEGAGVLERRLERKVRS